MRFFLINSYKIAISSALLLAQGCFATTDSTNTMESTLDVPSESIDSLMHAQNEIISDINLNVSRIDEKLTSNEIFIKNIQDSLKLFKDLNISGETSEQDIINSLIRIQSKLNLIEERIFYSDSLYFNLLNDIVLIESQIQDLDQNIGNIAIISDDLDEKILQSSIDTKIEDYKQSYDEAIGYYMEKDFEKSVKLFKKLISYDKKNTLSDNSQFWIGQAYYEQKKYKIAIDEYIKVSALGDSSKSPDATYKIALSYFNLEMFEKSLEYFNIIISSYPGNADLVTISKKYIERYK